MITMDKTRIMMLGTLLFAAATLTLSCATMRVTDEWRDKTFEGPPYKKIMVIALTKRADLRQPMEDEFSRQIKARGGEAVACYVCIPDIDRISRETLSKVGTGLGIEAYLVVMVMRTDIHIESYRSSIPPTVGDYSTGSMLNMELWGSADPPLQKRSESMTLESRLYDGKSAKLIWRSIIESVSPSAEGDEIPKLVRTVLATLGDEKLIPQSK
jgi:hypothetical protein